MLALGTALASVVCATAANADVGVTLTSGLDFKGFNAANGATSGIGFSDEGTYNWKITGMDGSTISDLSYATDSYVDGVHNIGSTDTTSYLFATGDGTNALTEAIVTWTASISSMNIYWGTPDSYNTLTLYDGATEVGVISGSEIGSLVAASSGSADVSGQNDSSVWVHIVSSVKFDTIVATSTAPAFEFDLAAPEPSTWAMMGLGFAALGFAGFRRSVRTGAAHA